MGRSRDRRADAAPRRCCRQCADAAGRHEPSRRRTAFRHGGRPDPPRAAPVRPGAGRCVGRRRRRPIPARRPARQRDPRAQRRYSALYRGNDQGRHRNRTCRGGSLGPGDAARLADRPPRRLAGDESHRQIASCIGRDFDDACWRGSPTSRPWRCRRGLQRYCRPGSSSSRPPGASGSSMRSSATSHTKLC